MPASNQKTSALTCSTKRTSSALNTKKTCENCPANLSKDDIIRGYEYEPGKYVTLTDAELEKIKSPKDKSMNIDAFVSLDEIDPILYQKSYYLAPQGGDKAFNLFAKALEEQKRLPLQRLFWAQTNK